MKRKMKTMFCVPNISEQGAFVKIFLNNRYRFLIIFVVSGLDAVRLSNQIPLRAQRFENGGHPGKITGISRSVIILPAKEEIH